LLPILDDRDPRFFDQYAYKITGSTTGALVAIVYVKVSSSAISTASRPPGHNHN